MDLMKTLYLSDVLHTVSQVLLVPVVVCLFAVLLYALYQIGTVLVELFSERKYYRAVVPQLVSQIETSDFEELPQAIEGSGLLRSQKDDLLELKTYLWLPEDGRIEVAKRLLATERDKWMQRVSRCEVVAKAGPMLGLMGTLIPLGPGLVALGSGDTNTLSSSLLIAFDTTTAGLAAALVTFVVAHVRKRWYRDYLVSMESAMNALLERGRILHAEGYAFEQAAYVYDSKGKTAVKQAVGAAGEGR